MKIKRTFMSAGFLALGMLAGIAPLAAQSYPGLAAPAPVAPGAQAESPPVGGYGGLTQPAAPRETIRSRPAPPVEEREPALQTAETDTSAADIQQSFVTGSFGDTAVNSPEELKIAALIAESAKAGPIDLGGRRLPDSTLEFLNRPQMKIDGMWPKEARTLRYIRAVFNEIQAAPADQRRDRIKALRQQIETMIDANLAQLAAPDSVSLQLGMTQQAIDETRAAAQATNEHLNGALAQLRR